MGFRLQSAMEYLTTYGWAILVVAIIIVALFQLGVFNGSQPPSIPSGACQVMHNAAGINLVGECNNAPPAFVARPSGSNGYIYASVGRYFGDNNPLTVAVWVYMNATANGPIIGITNSPPGGGWNMPFISVQYPTIWGDIWSNGALSYTVSSPGWYFVAFTYSPSGSGTYSLYINGNLASSASGQYSPSGAVDYWTTYVPGCRPGPSSCSDTVGSRFGGMIANVQTYNATLSNNEIQSIYAAGIGGAPTSLLYLTGWWPLNGNTNDYSGNANNGKQAGVSYISSWSNGYVSP